MESEGKDALPSSQTSPAEISNPSPSAAAAADAAAAAADAAAAGKTGGAAVKAGTKPVASGTVDGKQKNKKQDKKKKEKKKKGANKPGPSVPLKLEPPEPYLAHRLEIFERLYAKQLEEIAAKPKVPIVVTLPDGKTLEGKAWETTPYSIAEGISTGLASKSIVAVVNGKNWDLDRPLEEDSSVKFLKFEDEYGKYAFWHSSAHILGEALEQHCGGRLCYGPPSNKEAGFYYDTHFIDQAKHLSEDNFKPVEDLCKKIIKEKQPFQRLTVTKEDLLEMFKFNPFKVRLIKERVMTPTTTVYRCGTLIDLCRGPHVRHTGKISTMLCTRSSSSYWEGDASKETLQRMYAISFPDKKMMSQWKKIREAAAERDHRRIGTQQELFFFDDLSPGSCFFMPKGAIIYRRLMSFIRKQYRLRGFQEVITPNIFNSKLWETSGHWEHYSDDMFSFDVEKEKYALKPMNCPSHCVIFGHRQRSYKELPLRLADFGVLHRNEASGTLRGLTRVRRFQQDDAHIFCKPEDIESEVEAALDFVKYVYDTFGFEYKLNLSTRPEKFLGEPKQWDEAETALEKSLDKCIGKGKWKLNPGDGAFYGPKIDIQIYDALKREFQCATIQLDFQLPIRFGLKYFQDNHEHIPVIVHRAVLGSVERMLAILTESCGGKWPFWLSPRQVIIVPTHHEYDDYAIELRDVFFKEGLEVEADLDTHTTFEKKVRNAQVAQYNFILVVGAKEKEHRTANVRTRDTKRYGERSIEDLLDHFRSLRDTQILEDGFPDAVVEAQSAKHAEAKGEDPLEAYPFLVAKIDDEYSDA